MVTGAFGSGPATEIVPGLWQGGFPADPGEVAAAGFDVLVLAAKELQPVGGEESALFPGVEVICVPLDDDGESPPDESQIRHISLVVRRCARRLCEGKRVLVTCQQGRNRSGLLVALVLADMFGISGREAADRVRARRPLALTNTGFSALLDRIPPR